MADKIQDFCSLIATLTGSRIIAANQAKTLPAYPFITYQTILENRHNLSVESRIETILDTTETKIKRIESQIQFDVYGTDVLTTSAAIRTFIDNVEYKYRNNIIEANYGIVSIGDIRDNTKLEDVKVLHRRTVEFTIDYTEAITRVNQNLQSVSYTVNNEEITINRE